MTTPSINDANLKLAIIAYAKARPCIWNNDVEYSKNERDEAWTSLSKGFSLPVAELKKRWEGIRQEYYAILAKCIATGEDSKCPYYNKLNEFLRTPITRIWQKEGTMPKERTTDQREDIEYINLSSGSDSESNKNDVPPGSVERADSLEKLPKSPPNNVANLKTVEDVRSELRKIPPVTYSSGILQIEPISLAKTHQQQPPPPSTISQRPRLAHKKRQSLPDIPDAKRRLIQNCGELIALKKVDPNDALSRGLPLGNASSISSPPHKMFGSASANLVPSRKPSPSAAQMRKSLLKDMMRKLEKSNRKPSKKKISRTPAGESNSRNGVSAGSTSDAKAPVALTPEVKLPSSNTTVSSCADRPVTVSLMPSNDGVTLHSVPGAPREDRLSIQDVRKEDQPRERRKCKKKSREHKDKHDKKKHRKTADVATGLIVLDNSDREVAASVPKPEPSAVCQQNGLSHDIPDSQKPVEGVWGKWVEEIKDLQKTQDFHCKYEENDDPDEPETVREVRKNFLLSFLPDMAEMTVEQRRFFKSKLMYLACNIDQFL